MKPIAHIRTFAWHCWVIAVVVGAMGCSGRSSINQGSRATPMQLARVLSSSAAAELAAKLANEECERLYSKRPFKATQHKAVLEGDSYRWGRLDPGGPGGLSAVVTFRADGSQPDVKVYLSTDITKRR